MLFDFIVFQDKIVDRLTNHITLLKPLEENVHTFPWEVFFFLNFSHLNEIGNLIFRMSQGTEKDKDIQSGIR